MNWMFVTIFLENLMSIAMLYIVCAINDFTYITALCRSSNHSINVESQDYADNTSIAAIAGGT